MLRAFSAVLMGVALSMAAPTAVTPACIDNTFKVAIEIEVQEPKCSQGVEMCVLAVDHRHSHGNIILGDTVQTWKLLSPDASPFMDTMNRVANDNTSGYRGKEWSGESFSQWRI